MNNFFVNQDPLLNQPPTSQFNPLLYQQVQMNVKDNIGELDKMLKEISPTVLKKISENVEFTRLNNEFQSCLQQELLSLVRNKMNTDPYIIDNIKQQMKIIEDAKLNVETEKEQSLNEMNDYMKNYSHLTFDDYKKMKNGEPIDTNTKKKKGLL